MYFRKHLQTLSEMKKILFSALAICAAMTACDKKADEPTPITDSAVVQNYALIVSESYQDAIKGVTNLKTQIDAFVKNPTAAGLEACKKAWIDSRPAYLQTEAYRFYGGPIDDSNEYEGLINSWPLDESTIDYVQGDANAGLINDPVQFPTISKQVLQDDNGKGGETDVKVGYHAIEFLLWGQDFYADSPGKRPYTDYVTGTGGTAKNQARRAQYLQVVTDLLIEDLTAVAVQWVPNKGTYWTDFTKKGNESKAILNMFTGMGKLSKGELSGERMAVALASQDQEDEHSCFSDNTTNDIIYDDLGVYNVYIGRYVKSDGTVIDGPGLDDLVKAKDAKANSDQIALFEASILASKAIPAPFDQAIIKSKDKVQAAIKAIRAQADQLPVVAKAIGISLVVPETNK